MNSVVVHNYWIHYKDLLFRELGKRGWRFTVIFTAMSSVDRIGAPDLNSLPYRSISLSEVDYERASKLKCVWVLLWVLRRERPSIIVIGGWFDIICWAAWVWGVVHSCKLVLWAESNEFDYPRSWCKEIVKRMYVWRFDCAHVYGGSNREYLVRLGMEPDKIFVKRAVLDTRNFQRVDVVPESQLLKILYVGRLSPEKNLVRMIEAFAVVAERVDSIVLEVVGYGPDEQLLKALRNRVRVKDRIVFSGAKSQNQLPAIYSSADAFILPSLREPWGLVVAEAMCCGLPAAVSVKCGCAVDLVSKDTGWTFDPTSRDEICTVISKIALSGKDVLREMGVAARKMASQYSAEACAERVLRSVAEL